jgi:hypothetical protein
MLDMIYYKKFPFTEHQGKLPFSEKPSRNSCHGSKTSNPILQSQFINTDFHRFFKPACGSILSTMTWIYAGRSGVQISAEARELSFLQNIQTSSSTHPASNSSFFSGSKVASAGSLTTHICLEASLKISGAIPPLNLSACMAHIGTTKFYLYLLPMYISVKRSHPFWSYKATLSTHHSPPICTLHDTFISSSLIQLYKLYEHFQ